MRRLLRIAATLVLVGASCPSRTGPPVPPRSFASPDSLAGEVTRLLAAAHVPGAAVAVVRDGQVAWSRGYGLADVARQTPMTDSTVMQVASISKAVTAWGVMRLVERGVLRLDMPIDSATKRWHLPRSRFDASGVTIARVLSHTAGLGDNPYEGYTSDEAVPTLVESLSGKNDGVGDVHIDHQPGSRWSYAEGGYVMLQLAVEDMSGRGFADYMRTEVLEPLGMSRSAYEWNAPIRPRTATPYDRRMRVMPVHRFIEEGPDGLYTTAADLAKFVAATMKSSTGALPGRGVLAPETISRMLTAQPSAKASSWGLGYSLHRASPSLVSAGHFGTNPGWRATTIAFPDRGVGLVVMTNGDNGNGVLNPLVCAWARWAIGSDAELC